LQEFKYCMCSSLETKQISLTISVDDVLMKQNTKVI